MRVGGGQCPAGQTYGFGRCGTDNPCSLFMLPGIFARIRVVGAMTMRLRRLTEPSSSVVKSVMEFIYRQRRFIVRGRGSKLPTVPSDVCNRLRRAHKQWCDQHE
jgi:hypothetical protein